MTIKIELKLSGYKVCSQQNIQIQNEQINELRLYKCT